jgi:hypothetical protein
LRKACGKDAENLRNEANRWKSSTWWISFRISAYAEKHPHPSPTHPPPPYPPLEKLIFSIHFCISEICGIKCVKSLKIKGLRLSASLSACFPQTFRKLDRLPKTYYNKPSPYPTPYPWPLPR